jgi:hypothetical protein
MLYEELRSRRKHARLIGVGLSVALLLIASFVFIVVKSLPSMTTLRAAYFSSRLHKPVTERQLETVSASTRPADTATTDSRSPTTAVAVPSATPNPMAAQAPVANTPAPRTLADYATERFIDRGDRTLAVCSLLSTLGNGAAPFDLSSLNEHLNSQIQTSQPDPFAEAILAPLGAILQIPSVASVATEIRDAQETGDTSFLRQTQFYSAVAFAAADAYSNRSLIDRVSDHAYHLSVIARIAATIPGSGSDPALQDLCTAVEARTLTPALATRDDETLERATLLQLIGAMGLTPQQAGFDPDLATRISIQLTPTQLTLTSPWMTQMYRSGLRLSVGN